MKVDSLNLVSLNPQVSNFGPGDTVKVSFRVKEGERERAQVFQGVVIGKKGGGVGATFTVRRVTHSIGVERVFPLYSPLLESVEVVRYGLVRRAKLYYLRNLRGKAARIKERRRPRSSLSPESGEHTTPEAFAPTEVAAESLGDVSLAEETPEAEV
jgi:large subunit ribosomal protein L19